MPLSWSSWFLVKTRQRNRRICLDAGLRLFWGFKHPLAPVELRASALIDWVCSRWHPPPCPQPVHDLGGSSESGLGFAAWGPFLVPVGLLLQSFALRWRKNVTTKAQRLGKYFSYKCRSLCARRGSSKEIDVECTLPSFFWSIRRKRDGFGVFFKGKEGSG